MKAHTPGPWRVGIRPGPIVYGQQGEQVANLHVPMVESDENKANARLIAAAPELLAALDAIVRQMDQGGQGSTQVFNRDACIQRARAAIAKARGES